MAITDPEAIRFTNEIVRPYCEKMRNMYWEFKALAPYWVDTIAAMVPNDPSEILVDGRDSDTELTGSDITNFIIEASNYMTAIEQAGVLSAIQKPCVRAFRSE